MTSATSFINSLAHTPSDQVKPMKVGKFFKALDKVYGQDTTNEMLKYISSNVYEGTKYKAGMEAFQKRLKETTDVNGKLSGDDQKYLADITHRVAFGHLKTIAEKK
jgi:hypothetical protein